MKLFEYAIIHHPKTTKDQRDAGKEARSVLVKFAQTLAKDANEVNILAARQIPDELLEKLDEVEIAVRPF